MIAVADTSPLTDLEQQLAAIQVSSTAVASLLAETRALDQQRAEIEQRIQRIRGAAASVAEFDVPDQDEQWLACLTSARPTCCTELLAIKTPIRDREVKRRAEDLEFSINLIDRGLGISTIGMIVDVSHTRIGQLMADAGFATTGDALRGPQGWRGCLREVEQRIKDRKAQRAAALADLEDALIPADERIKREAEVATFRATLRTMTLQHSDDGQSLEAFTQDGDPLPRSTMTDVQRKAFDWFVNVAG